MRLILTLPFLLVVAVGLGRAESFDEYQKKQKEALTKQDQEFKDYEKSSAKEFADYTKERDQALKAWMDEFKEFEKSGFRRIVVNESSNKNSVSMHDIDYGKGQIQVRAVVNAKTKAEAIKGAENAVQGEVKQALLKTDPSVAAVSEKQIPTGTFNVSPTSSEIKVTKTDSGYVAKADVSRPVNKVVPNLVKFAENTSQKSVKSDYTGIILDARGLGCKACLVPVVLDAAGNQLYGPKLVDKASAVNGMAVWVDNPETAKVNAKAGTNPIVVHVSSVQDQRRFVVDNDSAKTLAAMAGTKAVRECKVIFILD